MSLYHPLAGGLVINARSAQAAGNEIRSTMRYDVGRVSIPAVFRPRAIRTESQIGRLTDRQKDRYNVLRDSPIDSQLVHLMSHPSMEPLRNLWTNRGVSEP